MIILTSSVMRSQKNLQFPLLFFIYPSGRLVREWYNKSMKRYVQFLGLSYPSALLLEFMANTIGDGILFSQNNWVIFFIVWYGSLYTMIYFVQKRVGLMKAVLLFAILGTIAEIIIFKRSNLILDPIIYFLMALLPCWVFDKFIKI